MRLRGHLMSEERERRRREHHESSFGQRAAKQKEHARVARQVTRWIRAEIDSTSRLSCYTTLTPALRFGLGGRTGRLGGCGSAGPLPGWS